MTEQNNESRLMDHEYDGIQEYDNPLPRWWNWLFIGSIVFSGLYVTWYHIGVGPSVEEKYDAEVTAYVERLLEALGEIQADDATIVRFMNNEDWMKAMSGTFVGNCSQCHAADGGGGIGPNLTDDRYKNVTTPKDIYDVIANGIEGASMAAWKDRLRDPQIILLASYVASLRGTTPANPIAPEGNVAPPWPEAPAEGAESGGDEAGDAEAGTGEDDTAS
jgi:cytochrome c oxidase cbb3-type subunit 3